MRRLWYVVIGLVFAAAAFAQTAGHGLVMVLIGPPGSGKTTQAQLIREKYKVAIISTDQRRQKDSAKLDEWVRQRARHADAAKGFVIDGYPGTRAEADALAALVKELKLPSPIILHLAVSDEVARERIAKRDGKQFDAAALDGKLAGYHKEMDLIRSYYPEADIWTLIGTKPPSEVFGTIVALVEDRK